MNLYRSSVVNNRSLTQCVHRFNTVCAQALKQWFSQVVMMDDPYDEAEQKQLAEKLRREMAFLPDPVHGAMGFNHSGVKSAAPQAAKVWLSPPYSRKYESQV